MTRPLSPRDVAIADQIQATLADENGIPVSTPELWQKTSPYRTRAERRAAVIAGQTLPPQVPYGLLWRLLRRLEEQGAAERVVIDGMRACYWRSCPDTTPGTQLSDLEAGL